MGFMVGGLGGWGGGSIAGHCFFDFTFGLGVCFISFLLLMNDFEVPISLLLSQEPAALAYDDQLVVISP